MKDVLKGKAKVANPQPFLRDGSRDWEICYEAFNRQYIVMDCKSKILVAVPEHQIRDGLESDAAFFNLIRYIDGFLCDDKGVSKIKLPVVSHKNKYDIRRNVDRLNTKPRNYFPYGEGGAPITESEKRQALEKRSSSLARSESTKNINPTLDISMESISKQLKECRDSIAATRDSVKKLSETYKLTAPPSNWRDAVLLGHTRSVPPVRKSISPPEVETPEEWAKRVSWDRRGTGICMEAGAFTYSLGAWLLFKSRDGYGIGPFVTKKLKKVKRYFVDHLEETGYQGAIIIPEGEHWYNGNSVKFYFRSTQKAEEAKKLILHKLGY